MASNYDISVQALIFTSATDVSSLTGFLALTLPTENAHTSTCITDERQDLSDGENVPYFLMVSGGFAPKTLTITVKRLGCKYFKNAIKGTLFQKVSQFELMNLAYKLQKYQVVINKMLRLW